MKSAGVRGTVSIELVHEALNAANVRNLEVARVLEAAKLDRDLLRSAKARISAQSYSDMWVALADLMDDEFFGLDSHGLRRGSQCAGFECACRDAERVLDNVDVPV